MPSSGKFRTCQKNSLFQRMKCLFLRNFLQEIIVCTFYRHSSIFAVSISAIFVLTCFMILSFFQFPRSCFDLTQFFKTKIAKMTPWSFCLQNTTNLKWNLNTFYSPPVYPGQKQRCGYFLQNINLKRPV